MTTLEDLTDAEIASTLAHHESEVARLRGEQGRREQEASVKILASYWADNPEQTEIKVSDNVELTRVSTTCGWDIGHTVTVEKVGVDEAGWWCRLGDPFATGIFRIKEVSDFRAAYLASAGSAAPADNGNAGAEGTR